MITLGILAQIVKIIGFINCLHCTIFNLLNAQTALFFQFQNFEILSFWFDWRVLVAQIFAIDNKPTSHQTDKHITLLQKTEKSCH